MYDQSREQFKVAIRDTVSSLTRKQHLEEHRTRVQNQKQKLKAKMKDSQDQKFTEMFSILGAQNVIENLPKLIYFSEDDNFGFRLLEHTQLLVDTLARHDHEKHGDLLLVLEKLSVFQDFEILEDTDTTLCFLSLFPTFPMEVLKVYSNYIQRERSCPNVIFHIMRSGIIQKSMCSLSDMASENSLQVHRFLCAVANSRPMLELAQLERINQMLASILRASKYNQNAVDQSWCYLNEYSRVKENEELANSLYVCFKELMYTKRSSIDHYIPFLLYLCRHRQLVQQVMLKDDQFYQLINKSLHSVSQKKNYYKVLEYVFGHCKIPSCEVLDQSVFGSILELFEGSSLQEKHMVAGLAGRYIPDMLHQGHQSQLGEQVFLFLDHSLKSQDTEIVKSSLSLIELIVASSQLSQASRIFLSKSLESLMKSGANQENTFKAQSVLNCLEE